MSSLKGFTLVELLVVMVILAVLGIVGVTIFTGVTDRAEEARRKADIQAIAKAYELNYNVGTGAYQSLIDSQFVDGVIPKLPSGYDYPIFFNNNSGGFRTCIGSTGGSCSELSANCYCKESTQGQFDPVNSSPTSTNLPPAEGSSPPPSSAPSSSPASSPSPPPPSASPSPSPSPSPTPLACALTSASWATSSIQAGQSVNLTVNGTAACSGKSASFVVWEDDALASGEGGPDDPVAVNPVNDSYGGGVFQSSWVSEYQDEALWNPSEFYFIATLTDGSGTNIRSATPDLNVTQIPSPSPSPSPSPTPQTFIASTGFSSTQGANQWRYQYASIGSFSYTDLPDYQATDSQWGIGPSTPPWSVIRSNKQHPTDVDDTSRTWVAPSSGTATITNNGGGNIYLESPGCSDGTVASIYKNNSSTPLWSANITDGTGVSLPTLTPSVVAGDQIHFRLNQNGIYYCDMTIWDPKIVL